MKPVVRFVLIAGFFWLALGTRVVAANFDFETLRYRAKLLAAQPYVPPANRVPEWLLRLSYDEHRLIRFDPDRSWWRRENLPFQLQFFHPFRGEFAINSEARRHMPWAFSR